MQDGGQGDGQQDDVAVSRDVVTQEQGVPTETSLEQDSSSQISTEESEEKPEQAEDRGQVEARQTASQAQEAPEQGLSEAQEQRAVQQEESQPSQESQKPQKPQELKDSKASHGKGKKRYLGGVLMTIVCAVILMGGGFAVGFLVRHQVNNGQVSNKGDGPISDATQDVLPGGVTVPVQDVVTTDSDDQLMLSLLKMHNNKENFCYSPLSIRYALEMLSVGASGETKAQIDAVLGDVTAKRYENIPDRLGVANALWVKDAWQDKIKPAYVSQIGDKYGAVLKADSFSSANNINQWVEDSSFGLIPTIMSDDQARTMQMAALVNVLAIDMEWEKQFMKEFTRGALFGNDEYLALEKEAMSGKYVPDSEYTEYTMMRMYGGGQSIYYNLAAEATVLALDLKEYNGTKLQFVAFKPKDLQQFIKDVTPSELNRLMSGMTVAVRANDTYDYSFNAYIPRFEIDTTIDDLAENLEELGVKDAFLPGKADFSKMTDDENFVIDTAMHKTKFDFSEEGIKAAAVTLLGGLGAASGPRPIPSSVDIVVSINGPFMYLVRDKDSGDIWFTGAVYEPNRWEDDQWMYQY